MKKNALVIKNDYLPETIEELHKQFIYEKGNQKARVAKLKTIKELGLSKSLTDQALHETQDAAEWLLYAEAKMGEILKTSTMGKGYEELPSSGGRKPVLPPGISHKQSHFAQRLYEYQGLIEKIVREARENEAIPTRMHVLRFVQELQKEKRQINKLLPLPNRKYRTIIIDPPWPVEKIQRETRPNQILFDYPTMTLEEIKSFPIDKITEKEGCHIYLWTTHKFLPFSFELFNFWGVKYQCLLTWVKNVGFTPFSWMYSTEHVLFGRIGNLPLIVNGKRLDFNAKVKKHSEKPDEFYNLIRQVSPEPRIDVFGRKKIEGFDKYGNEQ